MFDTCLGTDCSQAVEQRSEGHHDTGMQVDLGDGCGCVILKSKRQCIPRGHDPFAVTAPRRISKQKRVSRCSALLEGATGEQLHAINNLNRLLNVALLLFLQITQMEMKRSTNDGGTDLGNDGGEMTLDKLRQRHDGAAAIVALHLSHH